MKSKATTSIRLRWLALAGVAAMILIHSPATVAQDASNGGGTDAAAIRAAVDSPARPADDKARDRYRHPFDTLNYFGIKPDMTVVEIWPGAGWYTDILAPLLQQHGKLYVAVAPGENSEAYREKLAADPSRYGKVIVMDLAPPSKLTIAPPGSADLVLTFRNVHNWMKSGYARDVFKAMFAALKPGGILGVVEHRGNPAQPQDPKASSGYVREDYVIKLAEQAGFQLAGHSEINANPKDTRDYSKGVWTLPPVLRLGDVDRAKYLAIGESDRMTLRFIRPIKMVTR